MVPAMSAPQDLAIAELTRVLAALNVTATLHVGHVGDEGDGFRWSVAGDVVTVEVDGPRGALFGAYDFLESLGVLWPVPGREVLPTTATLTDSLGAGAPALLGRCMIIGTVALLPVLDDWVTWCARNKINTIFFHTSPPGSGAIGAIPHEDWLGARDQAIALLRERDLVFELGGHGLTHLLPRDRFAQTPEAFRMVKGERRNDSNFCSSSPIAIAALREGSRALFEATPTSTCSTCGPTTPVAGVTAPNASRSRRASSRCAR